MRPKTSATACSPNMRHYLALGRWPSARVHGWVADAQLSPSELAEHIAQHIDAVAAECAAAGFRASSVLARGARWTQAETEAAARWEQTLLAENRY